MHHEQRTTAIERKIERAIERPRIALAVKPKILKVFSLCSLNSDLSEDFAKELVSELCFFLGEDVRQRKAGAGLRRSSDDDDADADADDNKNETSSLLLNELFATVIEQKEERSVRLRTRKVQFNHLEMILDIKEKAKEEIMAVNEYAMEMESQKTERLIEKGEGRGTSKVNRNEIIERFWIESVFERLVVLFVTKEKYCARARSVLRRMAQVLDVPWRSIARFEAEFAWHILKGMREQQKSENSNSKLESLSSWMQSSSEQTNGDSNGGKEKTTSKFGKYLTLGAAAVVGGVALTLTGGLAAPALIASVGGLAAGGSVFAIFGVGTAYVLGALGTTGVTAIFGVTGAGLAAHKMSKRIEQNLEIFRILPLRDGGLLLSDTSSTSSSSSSSTTTTTDDDDVNKSKYQQQPIIMNSSLNVCLYVPGFLKPGDELFDAFGSKNGSYYATIDGEGPLGLRVMKLKSRDNIHHQRTEIDEFDRTLLLVEYDQNESSVAKNSGILSGSAIISYHILETNTKIVVDTINRGGYEQILKDIERAPRPVRLRLRKIQKLENDREEIAEIADSVTESLRVRDTLAEGENVVASSSTTSSPTSSTENKPKPPPKTQINKNLESPGFLESSLNQLTRSMSFSALSSPGGGSPGGGIDATLVDDEKEEANWPIQSGEQFVLEWETTELTNLGTAITYFSRKMLVSAAAPQALGYTALHGLAAAVSWPAILLGGASFIDNPWSVLRERARVAGKELASILVSHVHGRRPITLIAYSTGTCVILECLKELDRMIEQGERDKNEVHGIVENVVLVSVPVRVGRKEWKIVRTISSGRVINCRAHNDWVLRFMYRLKSYDVISSLAGVTRQNYEGVEDIKLSSDVCYAHPDIPQALGQILRVIGLEAENEFVVTEEKEEEEESFFLSESDDDSDADAELIGEISTVY